MLPTPFSKTLRTLNGQRSASAYLRLAAALLLLAALVFWMARVPVTLYETSPDARLEIASSAAVVQAPITGRVVESEIELGKTVRAGDILVRLDANSETLQFEQEKTRMTALQPEIDSLKSQIAAEQSSGLDEQRASESSVEEARLRVQEAETPARNAEIDRRRYEALRKDGLVPVRDAERIESEAERLRNAVGTAHAAIERLQLEQKTRDRQRGVRIAGIQTEIARLETSRAGIAASIRRVDYDVERRIVRAPVSGTIGEAATLRPGSVVQEGSHVVSIVPSGRLRIVGFFPPEAAHGRIHSGAPARLRLKGYPWTEFGVVEARVAQVGGEDRDGRTRVELDVMPSPTLKATLRHGMPGELEIETERLPPLALVLRTAGQWATAAPSGRQQ